MGKKKQARKGEGEAPPEKRPRWRRNIDDEIDEAGDRVAARVKRQRERDEDK